MPRKKPYKFTDPALLLWENKALFNNTERNVVIAFERDFLPRQDPVPSLKEVGVETTLAFLASLPEKISFNRLNQHLLAMRSVAHFITNPRDNENFDQYTDFTLGLKINRETKEVVLEPPSSRNAEFYESWRKEPLSMGRRRGVKAFTDFLTNEGKKLEEPNALGKEDFERFFNEKNIDGIDKMNRERDDILFFFQYVENKYPTVFETKHSNLLKKLTFDNEKRIVWEESSEPLKEETKGKKMVENLMPENRGFYAFDEKQGHSEWSVTTPGMRLSGHIALIPGKDDAFEWLLVKGRGSGGGVCWYACDVAVDSEIYRELEQYTKKGIHASLNGLRNASSDFNVSQEEVTIKRNTRLEISEIEVLPMPFTVDTLPTYRKEQKEKRSRELQQEIEELRQSEQGHAVKRTRIDRG